MTWTDRLNLLTDSRHMCQETQTQIWKWLWQQQHHTHVVYCLKKYTNGCCCWWVYHDRPKAATATSWWLHQEEMILTRFSRKCPSATESTFWLRIQQLSNSHLTVNYVLYYKWNNYVMTICPSFRATQKDPQIIWSMIVVQQLINFMSSSLLFEHCKMAWNTFSYQFTFMLYKSSLEESQLPCMFYLFGFACRACSACSAACRAFSTPSLSCWTHSLTITSCTPTRQHAGKNHKSQWWK